MTCSNIPSKIQHSFYRVVFDQLDAFMALHSTGTGVLIAAELMRILPITLE
jgi:hypothetical protein